MRQAGFLICLLALLYVRDAQAAIGSRLIGGKEAEQNGYPYQASMRVHGQHKCGGSLLNRRWVLTSAHCAIKYELNNLIIVLGSNSLIFGGVAFMASERILHPGYVRSEHHDDLALLQLATPVNYSRAIQPVKLPDRQVDDGNCSAVFTGWESSKEMVPSRYNLKVIELKTIELERCQRVFPSVNESNICTISEPGQGLCYGDAGGALVADGVQIGIGSWGSPCARGYPDVHIRVFSYLDWIKPIIASESND